MNEFVFLAEDPEPVYFYKKYKMVKWGRLADEDAGRARNRQTLQESSREIQRMLYGGIFSGDNAESEPESESDEETHS